MPSPLSRKRGSPKKTGINQQGNFQPALKTIKSLVDDIADSEDPEDQDFKTKVVEQTSQSSTRNETGSTNTSQGHESTSKNRLRTISSDSYFQKGGILESFDSESQGNEDCLSEEQTETRALTEIERLEEVQTVLEERIKQTKELLQTEDRTRNQRLQGQRKLRRLELKVEKLEQRLELERAGKNGWTFVRRVVRKPKVGFHSSELLNRKVPLGLIAANIDTRPYLADVVLQEMEHNADVQEDINPPKPEKFYKSKDLQEFQQNLSDDQSQQGYGNKVEEGGKENNAELQSEVAKDADSGWFQINRVEELQDSVKKEQRSDRKEMEKGWLRISDRPGDFVKRIEDASDTKRLKEAWVNVNEQGRERFARKVFRANMAGDSFLSGPLHGRGGKLNVRGEKLSIDGRSSFNTSQETRLDHDNKNKEGRRVSFSRSLPSAKVVKIQTVAGTTSFLPPIPKSEAKKRPKEEQVEKVKDENDGEQQKERVLLIPNQRRLARRRIEIYLKQLEFVKSHRLDQKETLKTVASAVEDYYGEKGIPTEHEAKTTPRHALYLIGALSKDHLSPPTAPPK